MDSVTEKLSLDDGILSFHESTALMEKYYGMRNAYRSVRAKFFRSCLSCT